MQNPFDITALRKKIDDHKGYVLCNPWKRAAYDNLSQEACIQYWVEQIADAELYQERWIELEAVKARR